MEKKLNTHLSKLTSIPEDVLNTISDLSTDIVSEFIYESLLEMDSIIEIDIGIGSLIIKCNLSGIDFKFVPCDQLKDNIVTIEKTKKSPLKLKLKKSLRAKLVETYKEII